MTLVDHLQAAFNVTGPVLLTLLLAIALKKIRLLDTGFVATGNRLVFNLTLPALLFLSVATGTHGSLNLPLILYAAGATLASVMVVWWLSPLAVETGKRGVFTQCAFRGNMAIIGLALCVNAFGESVIAMAAVYLAFITILYNLLAVVLLSSSRKGIVINIARNPLIIAIVAGGIWSVLKFPMPQILEASLGYLARLTLPLALLCIGASLQWQSFRSNHREAVIATLLKLIILPGLVVGVALLAGFRGQPLGILFLMMASPTAAAAYVMSQQMTSHGQLAAEIITLSTALSPFTVAAGLIVLNMNGWL